MPFKDALSTSKDAVGIVRELAIVLAILILIFFPGMWATHVATVASEINKASVAQGAKQTEVNVLGIAKYTFDNTTAVLGSLSSAQQANEDSIAQLEKMKKSVSPAIAAQIEAVEKNLQGAQQQVNGSITSTRDVQLKTDAVIQTTSAQANPEGPYGVVVAADRVPEHAAYEVHLLKVKGFNNIAVFQRQSLYRTVARFPDKDSATAQLPAIQTYRPTAYPIDLTTWCKSTSSSDEVLEGVHVTNCQ
jgi:hypothetical protein